MLTDTTSFVRPSHTSKRTLSPSPHSHRNHEAAMSSYPSPPYTPTSPPVVSPATGLAFWNTHLPPHLHTSTCPSYLEYAFTDHRDRACLAANDSDFTPATWPDVQRLVRTNELDGFRRVPSQLRRYREYTAKLKRDHGSISAFILQERLRWTDPTPRSTVPFADPTDYKVLFNDWPYGLSARISHLVIWTKFELTPDPAHPNLDLTPLARQQIDSFVNRTFGDRCGRENVLWFKNWRALQSVRALEHFHVMILDADAGFLEEVTGGDVAMAERVGGPGEMGVEGAV